MPLIEGRQYAERYDCAFIGTSTISLLEALYQHRQGKRVLMIDDQPRIGGVWVSLDLFGLHDVENAIHYFIYDGAGIEFMRSVLGWNVIESPRKFRIFPESVCGLHRIRYDNPLSLIAARMREAESSTPDSHRGMFRKAGMLVRALREAMTREGKSHYFAGGTPDMMRHVEALARKAPLDLLLETTVERLHFDRPSSRVLIGTSRGELSADGIFITHGARLNNLTTDSGKIEIEKEVHRRPQIHLLIRDPAPTQVYEGIFVADNLIKYVHDVTRFTREAAELDNREKLLVIALQHDCDNSRSLYDDVFSKLKSARVIGKDATLEQTHWYESYLPELSDATLDRMKHELHPMVDALRSDNFCGAIGLYGERWRTALS
jgi:hypothetical protein